MDDRYLDNLIVKAYEDRFLTEVPPDGFFASIAARAVRRRRIRILTKAAAAASVTIIAAGALLYPSFRKDATIARETSQNAIYLESETLVEDRFERHNATQHELRASIAAEFPTQYSTGR